jgi:hypothetical protein
LNARMYNKLECTRVPCDSHAHRAAHGAAALKTCPLSARTTFVSTSNADRCHLSARRHITISASIATTPSSWRRCILQTTTCCCGGVCVSGTLLHVYVIIIVREGREERRPSCVFVSRVPLQPQSLYILPPGQGWHRRANALRLYKSPPLERATDELSRHLLHD